MLLCGWEGNHRSGITLAIHHRLSGISTYRLSGLGKGDKHLAYAPMEYDTFTFTSTVMFACAGKWCACWLESNKWLYISQLHIPSTAFGQVPTSVCSNAWSSDRSWYAACCYTSCISGKFLWTLLPWHQEDHRVCKNSTSNQNFIDVINRLIMCAFHTNFAFYLTSLIISSDLSNIEHRKSGKNNPTLT